MKSYCSNSSVLGCLLGCFTYILEALAILEFESVKFSINPNPWEIYLEVFSVSSPLISFVYGGLQLLFLMHYG